MFGRVSFWNTRSKPLSGLWSYVSRDLFGPVVDATPNVSVLSMVFATVRKQSGLQECVCAYGVVFHTRLLSKSVTKLVTAYKTRSFSIEFSCKAIQVFTRNHLLRSIPFTGGLQRQSRNIMQAFVFGMKQQYQFFR